MGRKESKPGLGLTGGGGSMTLLLVMIDPPVEMVGISLRLHLVIGVAFLVV